MPTVPQYGDRQVRTAPLPAPQQNPNIANADVYGASIAQGAAQATNQIAAARKEARDRVIQTDASAGLIELSAANDDMMYRKDGYMNRKGNNARGSVDEYEQEHKTRVDQIAAQYKDPETQQAFRDAANRQFASHRTRVASRSMQELSAYEVSVQNGLIATSREDSVKYFLESVANGNQEDIATATAGLGGSIDQQTATRRHLVMDIEGLSDTQADIAVRADTSATIASATTGLLAEKNYKQARALYDSYEGQLDTDTRKDLLQKVKFGEKNQQAQDTSDEIFQNENITPAQANEMILSLKDADLRQRTQTIVDSRFAHEEAIKDKADRATYEKAASLVEQGENPNDLFAADPAIAALDSGRKAALFNYQRQLASGREPLSSGDTYYDVRLELQSDPASFMKRDLQMLRGKVTSSELDELMKIQTSVSRGDTTSVAGIMTVNDVVEDVAIENGLVTTKVDGAYDPEYRAYMRQLDKAVRNAGGAKEIGADGVRKLANELVIKYNVEGKNIIGRTTLTPAPAYKLLDDPRQLFPEATDEDIVNIKAMQERGEDSEDIAEGYRILQKKRQQEAAKKEELERSNLGYSDPDQPGLILGQ